MSILNRLLENLFGGDDTKKEALFHCAEGIVRKAAGRILEIGLDQPKGPFYHEGVSRGNQVSYIRGLRAYKGGVAGPKTGIVSTQAYN